MTSSSTTDVPTSASADGLVVRTSRLDLDQATALVELLPTDRPVTWLRRDDGLVGWGVAAEVRTSGSTRFADAVKWWSETTSRAVVTDDIGEPGSGLVCFGSFAFSDEPGDSVLVVPRVVVGRRGDTAWVTTVDVADPADAPVVLTDLPAAPTDVSFADGALDGEHWMSVVVDAS